MSANTSASARSRPTIPVKGGLAVIGAGFGRTGTSSLQEALEILGYGPCYHMREVSKDPKGLERWDKIGQGEKLDWDEVFFGYKSTMDLPAATYYSELLEHYPSAKVILSVRDEEQWAKSVMETIGPSTPMWSFLYQITFLRSVLFARMAANTIWKPFCGGIRQARNKDNLIAAFRAHNAKVKATVSPDQLLVFDVKDGWGDLCKFLEVPAPDVPFPRSWDSIEFKKMVAARKKKALTRLLGAGVIVTLAVGFGVRRRQGKSA